jgi:hypothetical protein
VDFRPIAYWRCLGCLTWLNRDCLRLGCREAELAIFIRGNDLVKSQCIRPWLDVGNQKVTTPIGCIFADDFAVRLLENDLDARNSGLATEARPTRILIKKDAAANITTQRDVTHILRLLDAWPKGEGPDSGAGNTELPFPHTKLFRIERGLETQYIHDLEGYRLRVCMP